MCQVCMCVCDTVYALALTCRCREGICCRAFSLLWPTRPSHINWQRSQWPARSVMYLNNWDQWDRQREEAEQSIIFKTFPLKMKLKEKMRQWSEWIGIQRRNNNCRGRVMTVAAFLIMQYALALTCWGSLGRTGGQGIHNGSCAPSQAPRCTAAGWTHGSCQNCLVDHWRWGAHTPQNEECKPAAYWSPPTASSEKRGKGDTVKGIHWKF